MNVDSDIKLYNDYINGQVEAFEKIYLKYKNKIEYFVLRIVKDYEKAEDITQEVFFDLIKNKFKETDGSLKYYLYLIAKSKSLTYLNTEKRRNNITEKYLTSDDTENDILDTITEEENKKELMEAISIINEKYRDVIYLVKIEEFSYKEVASILNISIQDVKNYVHRGKKELRNIFIKKGYKKMNKVSKICIIVVCVIILTTGVAYAVSQIYDIIKNKANLTPILALEMKDIDENNIWVGSFQIAWNEFVDKIIGKDIVFEDGESILANELNKKSFTKDMISSNDYYIKIGKTSNELKKEILQDINKKFKISNSSILDKVDFNEDSNSESYTIYSVLYKNFEFLTPFDKLHAFSFNNSQEAVEYFGITKGSLKDLYNNVDVLFYNNENDFAVKLNTKNNEDLILYCNNSSTSFNNLFNEVKEKTEAYKGKSEFTENDELAIPYMNLDIIVNYDELCNRVIQGTNELYIENAFQNVKFSLNEKGGNVISEAAIKDAEMSSGSEPPRIFFYDKPFVIFLKESNKNKPYFALKVNNTDVLVKNSYKEVEKAK